MKPWGEHPERIDGAEVIRVIRVALVRGKGVDGDPVCKVWQYYSEDGVLLAERDEGECLRVKP